MTLDVAAPGARISSAALSRWSRRSLPSAQRRPQSAEGNAWRSSLDARLTHERLAGVLRYLPGGDLPAADPSPEYVGRGRQFRSEGALGTLSHR